MNKQATSLISQGNLQKIDGLKWWSFIHFAKVGCETFSILWQWNETNKSFDNRKCSVDPSEIYSAISNLSYSFFFHELCTDRREKNYNVFIFIQSICILLYSTLSKTKSHTKCITVQTIVLNIYINIIHCILSVRCLVSRLIAHKIWWCNLELLGGGRGRHQLGSKNGFEFYVESRVSRVTWRWSKSDLGAS